MKYKIWYNPFTWHLQSYAEYMLAKLLWNYPQRRMDRLLQKVTDMYISKSGGFISNKVFPNVKVNPCDHLPTSNYKSYLKDF